MNDNKIEIQKQLVIGFALIECKECYVKVVALTKYAISDLPDEEKELLPGKDYDSYDLENGPDLNKGEKLKQVIPAQYPTYRIIGNVGGGLFDWHVLDYQLPGEEIPEEKLKEKLIKFHEATKKIGI